MKRIILLLIFSILAYSGFSKHIDEGTARLVAKTFFNNVIYKTEITLTDLSLAEKYIDGESIRKSNSDDLVYFYVFNLTKNKGFIIVSGDDNIEPVLGYSKEGNYNSSNLSPNFQHWLEGYKQQIKSIIENNNQQSTFPKFETLEKIKQKWEKLITGTYSLEKSGEKSGAGPLLETFWDQSPYYNSFCPGASLTGCVATAMAQIMRYWKYPYKGTGSHTYTEKSFGVLSAVFDTTVYNWGNMPARVLSYNEDVATLMLQCGVSVEMSYSMSVSGAWVILADSTLHPNNPYACAEYSYKTYFGYDPKLIHGIKRIDYTDANWKNILKNDLDNGRPIQYAGQGAGGAHTWVCDGYDANDYYHMNWGWGGQGQDSINNNGFFILDSLRPTKSTYTSDFTIKQQCIIGIQPMNIGIYELTTTNNQLIIYPNPASNYITIKIKNNEERRAKSKSDYLRITNTMGQIVLSSQLSALSSYLQIDISKLKNGIYYLEACNNNKRYFSKFIVEK